VDVIPLSPAPDGAPTATATCAGCGAPLAPDQRYCLTCGRPCSPVRLAFLDVLQAEHPPAGAALIGGPQMAGFQLPPEPDGLLGSLRRYSGLFGLLAVLLASLLIGLLVGHWVSGGSSPAKQVLEVKGLPAALAAAPAAGATPAGAAGTSTGSGSGSGSSSGSSAGHGSSAGSGSSQSHSSAKSEQAEEAEAAKEVKTTKALPAAHKTSSSELEKIAHTTGKQHAKEVAALGNEPIETGGH
jgi:hypothetical protein